LLKLNFVFLKKFITLFIVLFISFGFIAYIWLKNLYIDEIKNDIINNIKLIEIFLNKEQDLDKLVKQIRKKIGYRVTIINQDGVVIAESNKDKELLDNHKNRPEILQASIKTFGESIRYSHTIKQDLLYVAQKISLNHKIIFIRMASSLDKINNYFYNLAMKITISLIIFFIIAIIIAMKLSQEIEDETNKILKFLNKLSKQKRASNISSNYSVEFYKITKILTKVSQILAKRDKQKAKYTAKLKLSNRQKDDIISAISHEFKNPIAVISGYTQTLIEEENINSSMSNKFLTKIYSNANKLTQMIDRLRLSVKLEENKHNLNLTNINTISLLTQIIDDLKITYPSREIIINQNEVLNFQADETLITIALTNIIENSLKYSYDDIIINIQNSSIEVIDKGIGIKEEDISKITDKFYRVSSNSWNNSLGIGLSLVKNIIQLHNFTLDIQSQENIGSRFKINIK